MRDPRGRIAATAIDQPFIADRRMPLRQLPEKARQLGMCLYDRIEMLGAADLHLAFDDRLEAIFSDALARQNPVAGEAQGDNLPPSAAVRFIFGQYARTDEDHFVAGDTGLAQRAP